MNIPTVTESTGIYRFSWEEEYLTISVSRVSRHRDGRVVGEINVETSAPSYHPHLHQAQFNFSSTRARADLSRVMQDRYPEADWDSVLEQLCHYTLELIRHGEPVRDISTTDVIEPPEYLLEPIIPLNHPTVLFGDGGTGKSLLALSFAVFSVIPWENNPLDLITRGEPSKPLYLDYETDEAEMTWRLSCLQRGMGLPDCSISYRRGSLPLADDLEQVQHAISSTKAKFIIVDSIGAACGGDLNSAETAIRFFNGLRQLRVTSLLISHTAKDQISKSKTIFGSAYFHNFARSVWEVRKVQDTGQNEISIGLFHRKSNLSGLYRPIGIRISFSSNETVIKSEDVKSVPEFLETLSNAAKIEELLSRGLMEIAEISEELGMSKEVVRVTLNRMKDRRKVTKVGNQWGLVKVGVV